MDDIILGDLTITFTNAKRENKFNMRRIKRGMYHPVGKYKIFYYNSILEVKYKKFKKRHKK